MRSWEGIHRETAATADGAIMATNVRLYFEGEMQRRLPRERMLVKSARLGLAPYGPPKGGQFVVYVTADGSLEVVSA